MSLECHIPTAVDDRCRHAEDLQRLPRRPDSATILMVDDEKLNSFVVAVYLKAAGYRELVHTVDPLQAMALATRTRPDVILLDIEMPGLNGIELLERLRAVESLSATPVVILSATNDERIKQQAASLNVMGFLKKPIHKEELLNLLHSILDPAARGSLA